MQRQAQNESRRTEPTAAYENDQTARGPKEAVRQAAARKEGQWQSCVCVDLSVLLKSRADPWSHGSVGKGAAGGTAGNRARGRQARSRLGRQCSVGPCRNRVLLHSVQAQWATKFALVHAESSPRRVALDRVFAALRSVPQCKSSKDSINTTPLSAGH